MLVISLRRGESVDLFDRQTGDLIGTVTFVENRGHKKRLGFDFPRSIVIKRLHHERHEQNLATQEAAM